MKVGVTGKGERVGNMLPVINNNMSKGPAGPAGDKTGSRDTRNPGTQRRLCHRPRLSSQTAEPQLSAMLGNPPPLPKGCTKMAGLQLMDSPSYLTSDSNGAAGQV